jgi:SAM-dependent methyltransferase
MSQTIWKRIAKRGLHLLPGNGRSATHLYRMAALSKHRATAKVRVLLRHNSLPDPETVYWIDPKRIMYLTNYPTGGKFSESSSKIYHRDKTMRAVRSGDWDLSDHKFTDLEIYKAIEQRIVHGEDWHNTILFKESSAHIESGENRLGNNNKYEIQHHCNYIDSLFQFMARDDNKYKNEALVASNEKPGNAGHLKGGNVIICNIGRDGSYLFLEGRISLAIAKILGLSSIAVKVLVRHQEWQQLREFMLIMAKGSGGAASHDGLLYQPVLHPDLRDIPAAHNCEERFLAIKDYLPGRPGRLLDIGANLGYFCHKFEDLGYDCYAIELLHEVAWAATKLRDAEKKSFTVITGDLFDAIRQKNIKDIHFDIVLALNIFHHFIKSEDGHRKLEKILSILPVEMMFFEAHRYDEPQMRDAYANYTEREFVDLLLRYSPLNRAEFIYQDSDGRKLYKLYK